MENWVGRLRGGIVKWKAHLCAGGHCSVEFVDYWSTYSHVVSWQTIQLIFTLAIINAWHTHSIDFVMAFPQTNMKNNKYMRPPTVPSDFIIPDLPSFSDSVSNIHTLLENLYGLKDVGWTWNHPLTAGLLRREWKQSSLDKCLFTKKCLILSYTLMMHASYPIQN